MNCKNDSVREQSLKERKWNCDIMCISSLIFCCKSFLHYVLYFICSISTIIKIFDKRHYIRSISYSITTVSMLMTWIDFYWVSLAEGKLALFSSYPSLQSLNLTCHKSVNKLQWNSLHLIQNNDLCLECINYNNF